MYLKALEVQGFKSFPDKTVLNFGEDITAIVGPNGSGKSNISDAIRWVMGEQSSKALRGGKMEDVIFGGTEKRAPVGFAQVTLVLDNTGHLFPSMDESEVAVTRRYYRSGESEYYINRQSVRLKDMTELFMDTGMGREGYSIVGQGRVDEILSTKSTDRREIFEEAAGISKYRHRKEEAERKLERTEENLVRINDKIAELELQVEPLRMQAETAKKYLVLRDEMRLLEISLWLENLEALKANARKLEIDLRNAEQERDEARSRMDALFAENEQFGQRMQKKDMEAEGLRTEAAQLDARTAEQDSAVAVLESTISHLTENIERAKSELEESESRTGGYEVQAVEQDAQATELEQQAAALNAELDKLLAQAQAASEQAGGAAAEAEAFRGKEAIAIAAAADARAEAAAIRAETEQIRSRRMAALADKETAERQLEEQGREAKANRRALEDAQEDAEAAANIISGHTLRMEERKKKGEDGSFYTFNVKYAKEPLMLNIEMADFIHDGEAVNRPNNAQEIYLKELGKESPMLVHLIMKSIHKENKRKVKHIGSKRFGIQYLLKGIYVHSDLLYFHTEIKNQSNVPFDVDYITFKVVDKKVAKRTAIQEQVLLPVRAYNYVVRVAGKKTEQTVFCLPKFTIPDDKELVVEMNEKEGGRHQSFVVENSDLVRALTINELSVK